MSIWVALAAISAISGLWLAWTFLRRGSIELAEGEQTISVYRDQIDAVARDAERGLISEDERAGAVREIEARALRAARQIDNALMTPRSSRVAAISIFVVALAGSGAVYSLLGSPEAPDLPLSERRAQLLERETALAEAEGLTAEPTAAAEEASAPPESFEEWWTLARERSASGDHAAAVEAYRKAAEASGDRPGVLSAYAEALTLANGNKVPLAAKIIFGQVLARQPLDPRARYYSALAKAQEQDFEGALSEWVALYLESAPDAPWASQVRRDIVNMARFTQRPLTEVLLDATPDEIAFAESKPPGAASPGERITAIEATLAEKPKNFELSIELARLYAGNGDPANARAALDAAKALYPGAPFVAQRLAEAERELGLTGAAGPTEADMAAAASMSEEDRNGMIAGMVAGLAARLEGEPDDLEGWLMLIRSYAVLQDAENARSAVNKAYEHFDGRPQQRSAIRAIAAEFGISM